MTDPAVPGAEGAPEPTENVPLGVLVALLVIPLSILGFVAVAWVFDSAGGAYPVLTIAVAFLVPTVTAFLYSKGAGSKIGSAGRIWFVLISMIAVVVGALASVIATAYFAFSRVGGDGGLFGSAFATTVANKATSVDVVTPLIIAVMLGVVGIVLTLRQKSPQRQGGRIDPEDMPGAKPQA